MNADDSFDRLIAVIYDASLNEGHLADAMKAVQDYVGSDAFHLFSWSAQTFEPRLNLFSEVLATEVGAYERYYGTCDPRRQLAASASVGQIIACDQHFDRGYVERSEFYQDYLIPKAKIRYAAGLSLYRDPQGLEVQLGLPLLVGRAPYTPEQLGRLARVAPHLQRAMSLLFRAQESRRASRIGEQALHALDQGVVALDARRRVLFANRRAEMLLQRQLGLRCKGGTLEATGDQRPRLEAAIGRVLNSGVPESLGLSDADGSLLHVVSISCIAHDDTVANSAPISVENAVGANLLLLINSPSRQRVVTIRQLMQIFPLTPAEARLAHSLMRGEDLQSYRDAQGVSDATVRTQLQSILRKTNTRRQQDLIRLLAALSSSR